MHSLLTQLTGGNLRSIGKSQHVIEEIGDDESLFDAVMQGVFMYDPVLRLRACDVCEKVSKDHPEWLSKHKARLLKHLDHFVAKEVRWHAAQMLARLNYTPKQLQLVVDTLTDWILTEKSNIVKALSLQAIYDLHKKYPELESDLQFVTERLELDPAPSVQARLRKLKLTTKDST